VTKIEIGQKTNELLEKKNSENVVQKPKRKTTFMRTITKHFDMFMSLFRKYLPEFICIALFMIFGLWMMGYLLNGFYGMAFQLESSIAAIGAVSSAGILSLIRYVTDSKLNSAIGSSPTKALTEKINKYISGADMIDENKNGIDDRQEQIPSSKLRK